MNEEGRWQEADGRREQLDIVSEVHAMNLPHTVDYQNSAQNIHPSNASYLNRNNLRSERRFIKPSACMRRTETPLRPLPPAFSRNSEDTPLELLCSSPETINPAIVTARYIQHLELSGQVTPKIMPELAKQAQAAIAQGKQAITDYKHSLERLKLANPQPNLLPWGF